jgi:hypothetical protein
MNMSKDGQVMRFALRYSSRHFDIILLNVTSDVLSLLISDSSVTGCPTLQPRAGVESWTLIGLF